MDSNIAVERFVPFVPSPTGLASMGAGSPPAADTFS
jgi:hypothetical protein